MKTPISVATAVLVISLIAIGEAAAQQPRMNAGLTHMLGLFRLRIVAGRITVAGAASFQTHKGEFKTNDRHERLELTQAGPSSTFHYELTTSDTQLTWDLLAGNEIRIRRLPRHGSGQPPAAAAGENGGDKSRFVVFGQPSEGPLAYPSARETSGSNAGARRFGTCFWPSLSFAVASWRRCCR